MLYVSIASFVFLFFFVFCNTMAMCLSPIRSVKDCSLQGAKVKQRDLNIPQVSSMYQLSNYHEPSHYVTCRLKHV